MTITLLGEFTDLNKHLGATNRNRFMGAKLKKENGELAMKQMTLKDIVKDYPVKIHFTWITKNERVDPDNTAFAKKYILDALVTKGILRNDRRKEICGFSDSYDVDAVNPRVEVIIESVN
jgi:Holliday junction resolvase RusA-like endonuclease